VLGGVGVEVLFGKGGSGFGVWDGGALGFVDGEGACGVLLGLWNVLLLTRETSKVLEHVCHLQRVRSEFFCDCQRLMLTARDWQELSCE
jgi:hypothetical protein